MNAEIKNYKDEIQYGKPSVFFTKDKYVTQIDNLLRISNEQDQSVVLRSLDDLREYYDYSIIAVFKNNIIGNATAHPAEMVPKLLKVDQKKGGGRLKDLRNLLCGFKSQTTGITYLK